MAVVKQALGDALLTFMWVFCASTLGPVTAVIATVVGVQGLSALFITTLLVFLLLFIFGIIGHALGGASFNLTGTAAFYAAGLGGDSLISAAVRFPAQAGGAVGGALAIGEVMPVQYRHMLGGPSLKVDMHTGAIAEGVLFNLYNYLSCTYYYFQGSKQHTFEELVVFCLQVHLLLSVPVILVLP